MKSLGNYSKLTIRLSKVRSPTQNSNDGHGYRYLVKCDEIPGCRGYGPTISDALENFQKLAELWVNLV
jgi:predicted RNase H-like HicB family nuclease